MQNIDWLIALSIVIGGTFVLVGSLGLIKLPTIMSRLHGPSKATTLGVGGCLVASMLHFKVVEGQTSIQDILVTVFLFITAPVTAHFVAKAHLHAHPELKAQLPSPHRGGGWATYDSPPEKRVV